MTVNRSENVKNAATKILVTDHLHYKDFLQVLYRKVKKDLGQYSYLQFSEDLGFSKSNVIHLVICGRRRLTSKAAAKIIETVQLSGLSKRYFETLVCYINAKQSSEREEHFQALLAMKNRTLKSALEQSQLEFFQEWYHPVIYEMMRLADFSSDPYWVAEQLTPRIRPEQARKSIDLIVRLGLAAYDENQRCHRPTSQQVTTGDEIASIAIVRYHQRMAELGRESITTFDERERDISAITVSLSEEMAERIKREVQLFRKKILALAEECPETQRVYQLNMQLFPVTHKKT